MKKSDRFIPIAKVAETKEAEAAREVGIAKAELHDRQARLNQLQQYYSEYMQNLQQQGDTGFNIRQLQSYRKFLGELSAAIDQQKSLVQIAERLVEDKKQHWYEYRSKVKIYDKLIAKYQSAEKYLDEKREQSASDEFTNSQYRRKKD